MAFSEPRSSRRPRARRGALWGALALAPALLVVATLGAFAHPTPATPTGFTSYSTGAVDVVFAAPLPGIDLLDHANHAIGVALVIDNILEMEPGTSDHPIVDQLATPANSSAFQPTSSGGEYSFRLGLHSSLPVVPVHEPLWPSPIGLFPVNNSSLGTPILPQVATLVVGYSLTPDRPGATSSGVDLSWSIKNWPWRDTGDLLGVEAQFQVFNATGFHTCPAVLALNNTTAAPCAGAALSPGTIVWNVPGLGSVVGQDAKGLTASFAWGGTDAVNGSVAAPVTVGSYFSAPNVDRVTLAAPAHGATNVTSLAHLAMSLPGLPPAVVHALTGNPWAYGAAAALFTAIAVGGVVGYRRREKRLRDEL